MSQYCGMCKSMVPSGGHAPCSSNSIVSEWQPIPERIERARQQYVDRISALEAENVELKEDVKQLVEIADSAAEKYLNLTIRWSNAVDEIAQLKAQLAAPVKCSGCAFCGKGE